MLPDLRNPAIALALVACACQSGDGSAEPVAQDEIAYRVLVRSFFDSDGDGVGDLAGLEAKLDILNDGRPGGDDLGIDVLVVMPLGPSLDAIGYHSLDHREVSPRLGTEDDFRRLAEAAHARSMRLVVEIPLTEVSVAHPTFQEAITDLESEAGQWFRWREEDPGWVEPWEGMKTTTWHPSPRGFYYGAFGRELPQLRVDAPVVRADMMETVRVWRERGADGVRIPAASLAVPAGAGREQWNSEATIRYWADFARDVGAEASAAFTVWLELNGGAGVGERYLAANPDLRVTGPGFGDALTRTIRRGSGTPLRVDTELRPSAGYVLGLEGPRRRRIAEDFRTAPHRSRNALVLQLTLPGTAELFYGQAAGIRHNDVLSDVSRLPPLAWTGDPPTYGFTTGPRGWQSFGEESETRNVAGARADSSSIWSLTRDFVALRDAHPALAEGSFVSLTANDHVAPVVAYARSTDDETIVVAVNVTERPASVGPAFDGASSARVVWGDDGVGPAALVDGGLRFVLPPRAAAIWEVVR